MTVKVGDILKDNDPRVKGRTVRVFHVNATHAHCEPVTQHAHGGKPHHVRVALARIYDDGKPRKTGFSVVRGEAASA